MSDLFTREEQNERDARMAAAVRLTAWERKVTMAQPEARESKRQRAEATERYAAQVRHEVFLDRSWLMCKCDGRPDPHPAHEMREILNFKPWFRWEYLMKRAGL